MTLQIGSAGNVTKEGALVAKAASSTPHIKPLVRRGLMPTAATGLKRGAKSLRRASWDGLTGLQTAQALGQGLPAMTLKLLWVRDVLQ